MICLGESQVVRILLRFSPLLAQFTAGNIYLTFHLEGLMFILLAFAVITGLVAYDDSNRVPSSDVRFAVFAAASFLNWFVFICVYLVYYGPPA